MKIWSFFFVFHAFFTISSAFIQFPLDGNGLMDLFLNSISTNETLINKKELFNLAIPGEECLRTCSGSKRKVCYFKFRLEFYQVLGGACNDCAKGNFTQCFHEQCITADGWERGLVTVNRQLPGPAIQVCVDDIIIVDVDNEMDGTATTVHWHGLVQKGTPFSDGVPFITQCPIFSGNTFRYTFHAANSGTHLWHSHSGQHKANGIYGPIVVRSAEAENSDLYDFDLPEFVLLASDWMHVYAEQYFPGLTSKLSIFESLLINGHGRYLEKTTCVFSDAPLTIYNVEHDKRYRFRIINAASNVCPFQLQIEDHEFSVIASDGATFKPVVADTLFFISGERYDIVVHANKSDIRDYWVRVRALPPCTKEIEEFAVLRYHSKPVKDAKILDFDSRKPPGWLDMYPDGRYFNTPKPTISGIPVSTAISNVADESVINAKPDLSFNLFIATPQLDNELLFSSNDTTRFMVTSAKANLNNAGSINNISLVTPHFSLLSQPDEIDESIFCDVSNKMNKKCIQNSELCSCIHRLKLKLGSIVELVLIDIDDSLTHPFHLHGHKFYVMEMGIFPEKMTAEKILQQGVPQNGQTSKSPPHKDSILVPNPGYVRVKFRADNPGFWLGHCHFDWHLAIGMAVIFQVGELDQMKKPPAGYSKCKSFKPTGMY